MPDYSLDAVHALQAEAAWRSAGFDHPDDALTWWHAGFSAQDAQQWLAAARHVLRQDGDTRPAGGHAQLVSVAQGFKVADFSADQARSWRDSLEGVPLDAMLHEARRWRAAGFTAEDTGLWRQWGMLNGPQDLEFAVLFANAGWTPYETAVLTLLSRDRDREDWDDVRRQWVELRSPETLNYVKAGVTPEHARMFDTLGLQRDVLLLELRSRYQALPPLDPFVAMHLNDVLDRMFGDESDARRPFFAERVRDVRDGATTDAPAGEASPAPEPMPAAEAAAEVEDADGPAADSADRPVPAQPGVVDVREGLAAQSAPGGDSVVEAPVLPGAVVDAPVVVADLTDTAVNMFQPAHVPAAAVSGQVEAHVQGYVPAPVNGPVNGPANGEAPDAEEATLRTAYDVLRKPLSGF